MNILQILPAMNTGGVETGVVDLSRKLIEAGHKTVVVSSGGVLVEKLISAGVKHYCLPVGRKEPLTVWRMATKLSQIIRTEQIDIVHARSRVPGWIAWLACRRTGAKFVTTCHGYYSQHFFSRVMGWGCRVIVASQAIGRHMVEDFGLPYERLRFIPRGVDLEKFKFRPQTDEDSDQKTYRIGIIGRITPIKGHTVFIQAIGQVIKTEPDLKLKALIIGDADKGKEDYLVRLKQQVKKLKLTDYVDFLGRRDDIPEVLAELDLLVLPTIVPEAFGRVIIEAQAVGVPVIATRVGGIVDIIEDDDTGFLVPPEDSHSLAKAILRLIKDKRLRQRLIKSGRKNVEDKFTLDKMVEEILQVYEEVNSSLNILVIKLSALGDVVLSIPTIRVLRKYFPGAYISLLIGKNYSQVVRGCSYLNEVIIYHQYKGWSRWKEIWRISRILAERCFDISIDLQNNKSSHLIAYLAGIPRRYGYCKGLTSRFLTRRQVGAKIKISPVKHQFRVLSFLGLDPDKQDTRLELWPSEQDRKYIDNLLKNEWVNNTQILVGINPGSGSRWPSKRWPAQNYARLCQALARRNIRTIITGTQQEKKLAEDIAMLSDAKPIIVSGRTTLLQWAALIQRCKVFICGDTAALHMATAVGTKCVVLFGPTDPARHVPLETLRDEGHIIIRKDLKCSPCYKGRCYSQRCMKDISVDEVLYSVLKLLDIQESINIPS